MYNERGEAMTITEFAESRGIQSQVISIYIRRHFEEFKGHTQKHGKSVELDDKAIELLEAKYKLPQPIQVIEDTESRQKLIKAQEAIIQLQGKLQEASKQIAQAETMQLLLEDKKEQLAKAEERENKANERIAELEKLLQEELSKSWWDKLRGK